MDYAGLLRQELTTRNLSYAADRGRSYATISGEQGVVVYRLSECSRKHGNFIDLSYRAILRRPEWRRRLLKVHPQGGRGLPMDDFIWRELDSCMSSDALLMNVFCYPGMANNQDVASFLGINPGAVPDFGFRPRLPLVTHLVDRTEVDMKLGSVLFEAKLTEADFQAQDARLIEPYCNFKEVFDCRKLPRQHKQYVSYQLLRNVLAAYALDLSFCVLLDARRPDLLEQWYRIMRCVRPAELRTRCKILTWQELASHMPAALRRFLEAKYGIVSAT
jgi:hypothetical protein